MIFKEKDEIRICVSVVKTTTAYAIVQPLSNPWLDSCKITNIQLCKSILKLTHLVLGG